jgi:hypothetical protein
MLPRGVVVVRAPARSVPRRRLGTLAGVASFLLLFSLVSTGPAIAASPCGSPPPTFPTSQMTRGMTGVGYTVISGDEIEPFDVRVLGVMPDAFYLGIDVIAMEMTGPAGFLAATGGALHGMSGSPIYIQGRLAGSLSWGIAEDRRVFGVTAAEDMMSLFRTTGGSTGPLPSTVALTPEVRRAIAQETGTRLASTAVMEALPTPLGITSTGGRSLAEVQQEFADHGIAVTPFHGAAAGAPAGSTLDPSPLEPGGGFGMGLSYGDVTQYGFGTTTAVCGGYAIGWGHPFLGLGAVSMGLNDVNVIAIDNSTYGTKIGVLTEPHGTMIQDRYAGVVGEFGVLPRLVPIDSTFSDLDTGASRAGHTDIAWDVGWFAADTASYHGWSNVGSLLGADVPGTLGLEWTIEGEREDGTPFTVSNRTMEYSSYAAAESVWRISDAMYALVYNEFEPVTFTGVEMSGAVSEHDLTSTISRIRVASTTQPTLRSRGVLKAAPGDKVTVEVTFHPVDGEDVTGVVKFRVPGNAKGTQNVTLRGGHERYHPGGDSLDELIASLNGGAEHPNDLVLRAFGRTHIQQQDVIVTGSSSFQVRIVR